VPFSDTYLLNYLHASEERGQASEPFPSLTICENENMLALISISSYRSGSLETDSSSEIRLRSVCDDASDNRS
jgi:hypothetical protein